MRLWKTLLFFSILSALHLPIYAQEQKKQQDTVKIYQDIEKFSKKKKSTNFIHKLIFRPVKPKLYKKINFKENYAPYQCKIIRKIIIETYDPFGYSNENNAIVLPNRNLRKVEVLGNRLHLKSKKYTIRKTLLFKENTELDSVEIKESERILRTQRFVRTVAINIKNTSSTSDSVDVYVNVLDSWSLIPNASVSSSQTALKLKERNFMGQGHEIRGEYYYNNNDKNNGHLLQYTIQNIRKSFIQLQATNQNKLNGDYNRSINISRSFFSPLTRWGGGILLDHRFEFDTLANQKGTLEQQRFKTNRDDYWLGYAIPLKKENPAKITNFVLSTSYLHLKFIEKPSIEFDSIQFYNDEKLLLLSVGINSRNFIKERYLFNNGIIEDVPIGKVYSITSGFRRKNHETNWYIGGRASFGNYFRWGFFSMNGEMGTFVNNSKTLQTTFSLQTNYFTKLYEVGEWKIRQFLKQQFIVGNNRFETLSDRLTINENTGGIPGFNQPLYGTKKLILSTQTQSYSPWNLWGFRLNPFLNYTLGIIGNSKKTLLKKQTFSSIGLGFIVNNDYLVFSSFQLSFAYYPKGFNASGETFNTNAFESSDFGLLDFEINKPRTVIYK